jgi:capsular exopolysaccharide synthesis family protein
LRLQDYWRILVRRRWVFLSSLALVVGSALIVTLFATPKYQATTTIHIERQGPDILTSKDVMSVDPASWSYREFHDTQHRIIQSKTVARLAAERLDLANRPEFVARKGSPLWRLYGWLVSWPKGRRGPPDLTERAIGFIRSGLSVQPIWTTQLVRISHTDRDPALATDTANAVADAFLEFNFRQRYGMTAQATEFLTKEVARLQAEIAELERGLQDYGAKKEILALGDDGQNISERALSEISHRFTDAKGRLAVAEARYRSVRDVTPDSLPEVMNSSLISTLRREYAELERRHRQMAERFKPDWPPMKELLEEMSQARERLDVESRGIARQVAQVARTDFEKAKEEVVRIGALFERQRAEVQRVNRGAIDYASLKAEIDNKRRVMNDLITRQSQAGVSDRLQTTTASNIRVVDRAELPTVPVRPRKLLNMAVSLVVGLFLGLGLALLVDYLDNTVKSDQDLQAATNLAVLAQIPLVQPLRLVGVQEEEDADPYHTDLVNPSEAPSQLLEAFKDLRTALLLATPQAPPRSVVITSCEPAAGKSTVSLNLAVVLAQMGKRVLLVDGDLRRPRLHRTLRASNATGLSSLLSGNADLDEAVQDTAIPNLRLVTSGPLPPNPSELLGSVTLPGLINDLQNTHHFHHIVFDSSPVLSVADATILASRVDSTVIVARAAQTVRESLAQALKRLRHAHARVVGTVLNAASEEMGDYYGYCDTTSDATGAAREKPSSRFSRHRRRASKA